MPLLRRARIFQNHAALYVPAPGGGEATVTFDASNTYKYPVGSGADSNTHTVGAGSNRALVVALSFEGTGVGSSVVWDSAGTNQSMTKIVEATNGSNATCQIWGLVAPTSGAHTVTVAYGGGPPFVQLVSFTNVDQSTPFPNFASGTGVTTVNVTSATNRKVVGCIASIADPAGVTGTQLYYDNSTGLVIYAGASYDTGASTKAIGATATAACVAAIDIKGV